MPIVAVPDPVDLRLLALLAEVGRVAVHDLAARAGMDAREVAARLAGLAAMGLPLVVGVECDQPALRYALARQGWPPQAGQPGHGPPGQAAQHGTQSGPQRPYPPHGGPAAHSGPQEAHPPHGGLAAHSGPRGGVPSEFGPGGGQGGPGGGQGGSGGGAGDPRPAGEGAVDPVGTWGPPQTAAWARGDHEGMSTTVRTVPAGRPDPARRTGAVGEVLHGQGLDGERVTIQLVEVVDPADFLFTAAGYQLQPGERSVVVHMELANRSSVPFSSLPDQYLVLVAVDGSTVSKAPVSLSSRPPHRIGVAPGETAGGHTVYVLPEATELAAVRWSPRPDDESRVLTWTLRD